MVNGDEPVPPGPEPIVLPANTLRFRFSKTDADPTVIQNGGTWTKVENSSFNDWDWTCNDSEWSTKFGNAGRLLTYELFGYVDIIAAGDTSSVSGLAGFMSSGSTDNDIRIRTICNFDVSNVMYANGAFC